MILSKSASPFISIFSLPLLALLLLFNFPTSILCSIGDKSPEYQLCTSSCFQDSCSSNSPIDDGTSIPFSSSSHKLPFYLRITSWNCQDDCKYHCTHRVTNEAIATVSRIKEQVIRQVEAIELKKVKHSNPGGIDRDRLLDSKEKEQLINKMIQDELKNLRKVQKQMVQYHGKWVFVRFLGAQEPMSVLFSLLNLSVNFLFFFRIDKEISTNFPLKRVYMVHCLISINAWIWSSVFHTRDKNLTEILDYFSAGATVLSSFFFTSCRVFQLSPRDQVFKLLRMICLIAIILHCSYLSIGRFDYSYNMIANITVGISQTLLWLAFSLNPKRFSKKSILQKGSERELTRKKDGTTNPFSSTSNTSSTSTSNSSIPYPTSLLSSLLLLLLLTLLSTSFELFDFPPFLRLLDAHSLWHLSTVPLTYKWYQFLIQDSNHLVQNHLWQDGELGEERKKQDERIRKTLQGSVKKIFRNKWIRLVGNEGFRIGKRGKDWLELKSGVRIGWADEVGREGIPLSADEEERKRVV